MAVEGDTEINQLLGSQPRSLRGYFEGHVSSQLRQLFGCDVSRQTVQRAVRLASAAGHTALADAVRRLLFTATQYAITHTLDPEQSARYRPDALREEDESRQGKTYCNIHARDVIEALGGRLSPSRGLSANQLTEWIRAPRGARLWREITGERRAEEAQELANAGNIVAILASGTGGSGHISVVMAETAGHQRGELPGGGVSPVESNAGGGRNLVDGTSAGQQRPSGNWRHDSRAARAAQRGDDGRGADWWQNRHHRGGGFFQYIGPMDGPLGTAEELGLEPQD